MIVSRNPSPANQWEHPLKTYYVKSTDYNNVDLSLIKEAINCVIEPFTYICNKYFSTGTFPGKMKIAEVILIYKNGDKHTVIII